MTNVVRPLYQRQEFARAIRAAKLPSQAFELFDELAARSGNRGFCWPLQEELARVLGCSTRTVRRLERGLEAAGLLAVRRASLWARKIRGGTVRVLVLAVLDRGRLAVPTGALEECRRVVSNLWRTRLEARATNRPTVSAVQTRARSESRREINLPPISPSGLSRVGEWAARMAAELSARVVPRGTLALAGGRS